MSENRYKDALEQINNMNFNTGRADLLGLRVKEVIRRAFHPDEVCPQCNGEGKVPQIREEICGDCKFAKSTGSPWETKTCEIKMKKKVFDDWSTPCHKFENRYPMETCPSCNGKPIKIKEEMSIGISHKYNFFGNIDLEDNPPITKKD